MRCPDPRSRRQASIGLGLIELMVAIAISLVLVLAATSVYLASRTTQRSIDGASAAQEVGAFAVRLIGRDLMNAGFWPAARVENAALTNVVPGYINVTAPPRPAYDFGLFGCEGAVFDVATGTCPTPVPGAPDTLVVAYFTSDPIGAAIGLRTDCQGNDVAVAAINAARQGAVLPGRPPEKPLFVANHYTLVGGPARLGGIAEDVTERGLSRPVLSLGCNGIGSHATWDGTVWQAVVAGLDDLQFTYGVYAATSVGPGVATRTPDRFFRADEVGALPTLDIDGQATPPWARVSAVRVCLVARTVDAGTALPAATNVPRTYRGCDGRDVALPDTDRDVRRTFVQVFGVRNRQGLTY